MSDKLEHKITQDRCDKQTGFPVEGSMWRDFTNDGICIVKQHATLQTDQGLYTLIGFTNHIQNPPTGKIWYQTVSKFLSEHS